MKRFAELLARRLHSIFGEDWIIQKDSAAVQLFNYIKEYLDVLDVDVMDWAAKSPNLNIFENIWGVLARRVCQGGRQFDNVHSLQEAIMDAWNDISVGYIKSLY